MSFIEYLNKLQNIDRRILYLLVLVVVALPFFLEMELPIYPQPPSKGAYKAVESVPKDKIVLLLVNWAGGTKGESEPQTEVLVRHMFRNNIKFAMFSHAAPEGVTFGQQIAEKYAGEYHKKYGVDWVNWGYRPGVSTMIQGLARDIWKIVGNDIKGTPLKQIPMMRNVHTIKDVGLVVDVSPSSTIGYWIQYVQGRYGTPLVSSPTAVMMAETYPYLESGQLKGALLGLKGAAEYEELAGLKGYATRAMNSQSMAHLLIIVLIILGNIGYLSSRFRKGAGH